MGCEVAMKEFSWVGGDGGGVGEIVGWLCFGEGGDVGNVRDGGFEFGIEFCDGVLCCRGEVVPSFGQRIQHGPDEVFAGTVCESRDAGEHISGSSESLECDERRRLLRFEEELWVCDDGRDVGPGCYSCFGRRLRVQSFWLWRCGCGRWRRCRRRWGDCVVIAVKDRLQLSVSAAAGGLQRVEQRFYIVALQAFCFQKFHFPLPRCTANRIVVEESPRLLV